jgi:hypothetical protein
MAFHRGQETYPVPLSPARVVLHLTGPWPAPVLTHALYRQPSQPRLTLRCRTAGDVQVRVERLTGARWHHVVEQTGYEFSFLVKHAGKPFRLWVHGDQAGWVELIETRG